MEEKKYIQLGETTNILKLWITTKDGKETGEYLTFNMKDIELLDRYQQMLDEYQKNHQWIKNQLAIIDKKQDFTKKNKIMSNNEEMKYHAIKEFYKKEKNTLDLFLGEGGVNKLLYGRALEWGTIREIEQIITEQIAPQLDITMDNIAKEIKTKYGINAKSDVLE